MFGLLIGLVVTIIVVRALLKKYYPHAVLLAAGLFMMAMATIINQTSVIGDKTTGSFFVDLFEFIKNTAGARVGGLGLIIMSVAGFAVYMDHIGASRVLSNLATSPLKRLNKPYLVLGLCYTVGQILNVFIPSASGLALLLMVTMYPVLLSLGIPKISAAAVIVTTACLDLGPASGNANLAAKTGGIDVTEYFVSYQIPVSVLVILVITVLHIIVQSYFDKKEKIYNNEELNAAAKDSITPDEEKLQNDAPKFYAILPIIPLALLLVFSQFFITSIKMNVITAMFIGLFVSLICEFFVKKDLKKVFASIKVYFDGMGRNLASVITLIVAGETFAGGLKSIGAIGYIIDSAKNLGMGIEPMMIVMTIIISVTALLMGSGNAAFFAFAPLAPQVAAAVGANPLIMLLPMQLASGIARSASPILAATIAVAGMTDLNTLDVAKRALIPMLGGLIATIVGTLLFI